ncbi:hypothetical protein H8958_016193 [Nasalis larvatus]
MHLHQVLTGAVNPGDNCYSVGSVGDVPFTAYGSGCDIVILANDFECVQIIPGAKHGNIQVSCVECSNQQGRAKQVKSYQEEDELGTSLQEIIGKQALVVSRNRGIYVFSYQIAASYGNAVCIFEPLGINSHKRNCQLKCQWLKTGQFFLSSVTYNLAWDPQDNRLLTATDSIQLWAPPGDDILEEEEEIDNKIPPVLNDWKCIWQCKTSVSVHLMEWSPDGEYFATAGKTAMHEVQRHISHHANALCHFHIAASINPATDIPNVLVGTAFNVDDGNGGFVVHWLNNKEFHFTSSTEIFMHQLRKLSDKQVDHESDDADREDEEHSQEDRERGLHMKLDHDLSLDRESEAGTGSSEHEDGEREGSPRTYSRLSVPMPLPTVLLDRKIETLLTEWNKNPDMLFTIHPVDGYRPPPFSEKFFLVVIEKDSNNNSILHMWHLHLKSVQACLAKASEGASSESLLSVPGQKNVDSSPETSPSVSPMPHSSSIANLQTASKLILSSRLVYSQPLDLPESVEVIRATPSAGHLSSSSIYPVCLAPYLVVTTCSDNKVRFWKCCMETNPDCNKSDEKEIYHWKRWPLMNDEGEDNSSTVSIVGRPVAVSCSYTGRLAVAYKQPIHHNGYISKEFSMHVCIFECESTGGSEWVLEQTIHLDDLVKVGSVLDSRVSVDSNLFVYSKSDALLSKDRYLIPNIKHLVHLDWVSKEDGSHILTVGVGANIFMYGRLSGIVTEQTNSKDGVAVITLPLGGSIKQGVRSRWVLLRSIDLVSSVDGTPSLPVSLSWVRDGILVVGMDCEMHVYAQWKHAVKFGDTEADSPNAEEAAIRDHLTFKSNMLARKSIVEGTAISDDVFCSPTVIQDGGLFEAAHVLSPTLPQYHPTQLLELMDLGKVRRAKAILSHLVKCIAGEVAIVRDADAGEGTKRHLSRTISVSGSTAKETVTVGKDGTRDYTEIDSIPPLPLYALLAADQDISYRISEESTKIPQSYEDQTVSQPEDQYSELFQIQDITTDDIDLEPEKRENKSKVINLSQYGPAYFGQEHARVLSSHLMHSSLPGLTRLEQMFLVALADTVATTSTELDESRDKSCSGVSTCHFAWAFHSEAEEELINMIPAIQRGDPQWSELRAMGIGWWVRNINTLRRCIEKVAKASFQRNNDALDAALFYLSMKKKAVVWGLFRSQHDEKMTTFFSHNFNEDRWRKAALKNAFSLLGKQRFEQSAAFFLLAGSLKDAIEV